MAGFFQDVNVRFFRQMALLEDVVYRSHMFGEAIVPPRNAMEVKSHPLVDSAYDVDIIRQSGMMP